jgi:hypothetical protein
MVLSLSLVARVRCAGGTLLCLLLIAAPASAQDLDPRAYANVPVDLTLLIAGFAASHGGVLTDPTLPLTDLSATLEAPSLGAARTFGLFGRTAQAFAVMPYAWAQVSATVKGDAASVTRAGLSDMRLRFSVLVRGAPAATAAEIARAPHRTILGTSLTVVAPTGQFFSDKLINIGTNRWGVKPEFAVSHPMGQRWLLDAYAGLWVFTDNRSFYPGDSVRSQASIGAFQAHLSYTFQSQAWAAFDATYYVGGTTTVNAAHNDDRLANARIGATVAVPVGRRHSIKLSASRGALIRVGSNFTTVSIGWQTAWFPSPKKP